MPLEGGSSRIWALGTRRQTCQVAVGCGAEAHWGGWDSCAATLNPKPMRVLKVMTSSLTRTQKHTANADEMGTELSFLRLPSAIWLQSSLHLLQFPKHSLKSGPLRALPHALTRIY